jgi:hypothetical protein
MANACAVRNDAWGCAPAVSPAGTTANEDGLDAEGSRSSSKAGRKFQTYLSTTRPIRARKCCGRPFSTFTAVHSESLTSICTRRTLLRDRLRRGRIYHSSLSRLKYPKRECGAMPICRRPCRAAPADGGRCEQRWGVRRYVGRLWADSELLLCGLRGVRRWWRGIPSGGAIFGRSFLS